jgi:hypothetical protein
MGTADENLVALLRKRYMSMPADKRMVEVRKLARQSTAQRDFLKKFIPDLYAEAHPNA